MQKPQYKLIVSLVDSVKTPEGAIGVFSVFSNQTIPYLDVPDTIPMPEKLGGQCTLGNRYIVKVNEDATEVLEIVKAIPSGDWLLDLIEEVNKSNANTYNNAGKESRKTIVKPEELFMDDKVWEFLVATIQLGLYPLMTGPTGCGKTVAARSAATALEMDYYYINCGSLFKPKSTLIGTVQATDGSTKLHESEFLKYFSSDRPTLIFLDEISRIPSAASNMLMPVLDREQNYMYVEERSERIYKGEHVTFIAAANFGMQYVDARRLDDAFMNRFIPIHMDYLRSSEEEALIHQRIPGLKRTDVEKLVLVANTLRQNRESLGQEVSHRHTIDAARYLTKGFTILEVLDNIIKNLFVNGSDDRRQAADKIIKSKI